MLRQNRTGSAKCASDDIADVDQIEMRLDGSGFEPRHVEKICDEAIEPFGFLVNGTDQLFLRPLVESALTASEAACRAQDRRKRCLQIVRDRGQERRAK